MRFIEAVAGLHTGRFTRIRCQGVSYGNYGGKLAGSQATSNDPPTRKAMAEALVSGNFVLQAMVMSCCIDPVLMCSDSWVGDEPEEPKCNLDECYPEPDTEVDEPARESHPFRVGDVVEVERDDVFMSNPGLYVGSRHVVRFADSTFGGDFVGFDGDERGEWFADHFKLVKRADDFRVGDRVRFVADDHFGAQVGDLATVVEEACGGDETLGVKLDVDRGLGTQCGTDPWYTDAASLEHVV